ncbi:MAG: transporter permease [Paenibacillaceae bacterium]|jgi:ABC-type antimicrobial peptide transport system permease subunit|nr:transporter permease [Paenibacillaceae bacterium]
MRIRDILRLSWDQVKRRKVVTGLCAAGISIGCAAIVVAMSVGDSAQKYTEKEMNQFFKMDEITVRANAGVSAPGSTGVSQLSTDMLEQGKLTRQKLDLIRQFPNVSAAAPFVEMGHLQMVTNDNRVSYVQVIGTRLDSLPQFGHAFAQGGPTDTPGAIVLNYGATLGLNDPETLDNLMRQISRNPYDDDLMDQYRKLQKTPSELYQKQLQFKVSTGETGKTRSSSPLRVAGILKLPQGSTADSAQYDKKVYISMETMQMLREELYDNTANSASSSESYETAVVKVKSQDVVESVEKQIQRLRVNTQTNLNQKEMVAEQFAIIKMVAMGIGVFILIIASISIIVAMTMSTYQRRRQIGIMKVLGANLAQIRNMFIVEAALTGLLGGMLGILFSYWVVWGLNVLIMSVSQDKTPMIFIPPATIFTGMAFAIMTGVLSGLYPAVSASRTDALTAIKRD